jgi:drug/metabolite transporter (DMT)-like permease
LEPHVDLTSFGLGLAFALMWSSAFTTARIIVADAPPLTALALRFLISGVVAIAIAAARGQTWRLTRPQWRATLIFGICQNALYLGLFFVAMQTLPASLASIIASTMPLLVALIGWAAFREPLRPLTWAGLFAGLAGVVVIMGARLGSGADLQGLAICVIGVFALALATLSVRGATAGGNLLMIVGLQMIVGSLALGGAAMLTETWSVQWSAKLVAAFLYTTFVPGLLATFVWFVLVNRIGAVRAAAFHFLNPFFGVAIAALVLGEQVRTTDLIGVAVIMAGILIVQLSRAPLRPRLP